MTLEEFIRRVGNTTDKDRRLIILDEDGHEVEYKLKEGSSNVVLLIKGDDK